MSFDTIKSNSGEELPVSGLELDRIVKQYAEDNNMNYEEALVEVSLRNTQAYKRYTEQTRERIRSKQERGSESIWSAKNGYPVPRFRPNFLPYPLANQTFKNLDNP